jgi:hypothetical protein
MSLPSDTDSLSVFKSAMQSLFGGFLGWFLTCSLAGAIATATTVHDFNEADWMWAFVWIGHLAVAAFGVWGLLVICLHAFCVSALIHGADRPLRVVAIAFAAQMAASTIVVVTLESDSWQWSVAVGGALVVIAMAYLIQSFRGERRQRLD